jgi:iron-sulfur cluster assembly protein
MITITPQAAEQIKQAAVQAGAENLPLRVAARLDIDGSIQYGMGFDDERDDDLSLDCEGVTVLIAPSSQGLLNGATLDFVEITPGDLRFIFINPNDTGGSSCSSSKGSGCGGCGGGCG